LSSIAERTDTNNLQVKTGSIEAIEFPDNTFDAIFCYSVILMTDYRKAVKEFARVLKPQGKLYICANGLGWYLHNILTGHNSTADYDARQMGVQTIENTFDFLESGEKKHSGQIVIPGAHLVEELTSNGLTVLALTGEGQYTIDESIRPKAFFQSKYFNAEGVYEVIAEKK
jgi:SAM-dependent methyltransferase